MNKPSIDAAKLITIPKKAKIYMDWMGDEHMTCRQIVILLVIEANPGCGVGAIAAALNIPKSSVTNAVDKMFELGLAHRTIDVEDRRLVQLWAGSDPKKGER